MALLVCEGLSKARIVHRLGRSPKTVANQLMRIYSKVADYRPAGESDGIDRHALIVLHRLLCFQHALGMISWLRQGHIPLCAIHRYVRM